MKSLVSVLSAFLENRNSRTNMKALFRLLVVLFSLISLYSVLFHVLMENEGQHHSWVTGLYWTFTVMTTLGFGDITFQGDIGRVFSVLVMITGVMFLLVILPFTFIEFFYSPWMRAQAAARTPRALPLNTSNHVIFTAYDPVAAALIPMLEKYGYSYVILTSHVADALELYSQDLRVAVGALDDPETYQKMCIGSAAMLIASRSDSINANITFTARELNESVPIVGTATTDPARDVLELAGATAVLRPEQMIGQALARRVIGKDAVAQVIGETNGLIIAEANAAGTDLEGVTLAESAIRQRTGLSVIGIWDHGHLNIVDAQTVVGRHAVLVLAGTQAQIDRYNEEFRHHANERGHVIIVGGSKVARMANRELLAAGMDPVIIEKIPARAVDLPNAIIGDATHMDTLKAARAREATTIILTSHDDDQNISLTIFFRRLRQDIQIISRCSLERNVRTLHRAGADLVLSSASMGANTIFNLLRKSDTLLLAEGVCIFPTSVPESMKGRLLQDCAVRSETGCTIIAMESGGVRQVNLGPETVLPHDGTLLLVGTLEAEERFLKFFKPSLAPVAMRRSWRKAKRSN